MNGTEKTSFYRNAGIRKHLDAFGFINMPFRVYDFVTGYFTTPDDFVHNPSYYNNYEINTNYSYTTSPDPVQNVDATEAMKMARGENSRNELTTLSSETELGISLGGSLWGGAATMTYAEEIANGISTTTKGIAYLRIGGNVLGGIGFVATTYNNVIKIQNGTLNTADIIDWGISGGMLITGVLISNPIGLTALAIGGIGYSIYRLAAGETMDELINEKIGFRTKN